MGELAEEPEEVFTYEYVAFAHPFLLFCQILHYRRQRREHRVFDALLQMIPGLEDRLINGSEEDVGAISESVSYASGIAITLLNFNSRRR